ncbi:hypothetical protein A3SI_19716, partial [Nitritalea halalkaliphila LW7]
TVGCSYRKSLPLIKTNPFPLKLLVKFFISSSHSASLQNLTSIKNMGFVERIWIVEVRFFIPKCLLETEGKVGGVGPKLVF